MSLTKDEMLFNSLYDDCFSYFKYYFAHFNTIPSYFRFQKVSAEVFKEFKDWELVSKNGTHDAEFIKSMALNKNDDVDIDELRFDYFFKKGNICVRIASEIDLSYCSVYVFYDLSKNSEQDFAFVKKYIHIDNKLKFGLIMQQGNGLSITSFSVRLPEKFDIENYGSSFAHHHIKIEDKLKTNDSGLYIFHGPPGTGKSTYIKYLSQSTGKKFIFIPEGMVENLNSPQLISLLISEKNAVLVLEDAEKFIAKRDNGGHNLVSILLNLSDGILSDILQIPLIITYNTDTSNIDDALLRKGRLKYKHEFRHLSIDEGNDILKKNNINIKVSTTTSISDIINILDENGNKEKKAKEKLGF